MKRNLLTLILGCFAFCGSFAQNVTYDHDDSKMNQITVQEVGTGSLRPDVYYWALHNSYRQSAAEKNKLTFRTAAGMAGYAQVDDADKLDSAMVKRAAIEALNVADRTGGALDLAWGVEGDKVTNKLNAFENNIRRILEAGGTAIEQRYWQEQVNVFKTAIKATQEAYMPNAQRKKQYLAIYADITRKNESLVQYIVRLSNAKTTHDLLGKTYHLPNSKARVVASAMGRWRSAGWQTASKNEY